VVASALATMSNATTNSVEKLPYLIECPFADFQFVLANGRVIRCWDPKQEAQGALFYEFSIDRFIAPKIHRCRFPGSIDRFVDLSTVLSYLASFTAHRPVSIDYPWIVLIRHATCGAIVLVSGQSGRLLKRYI